jgi:NNP family nitrate/nitrite transporter-like MFS transporter
MEKIGKSSKISLFSIKFPHMRVFHMTWIAFFFCFIAWFAIAPLMIIVRKEFSLTKEQIGNIIICSVAMTVIARLIIGWLCDKIGPRITYSLLLTIGSIPVMLIGLSTNYESFLLFRLAIGIVGASFVITQFHTSVMFGPNVVGSANAITAGWGNLGGGIAQIVMPLIFAMFIGLGFVEASAWRYAMVVPGVAMLITGILYYFLTVDTPEGNLRDLKKSDPNYKLRTGPVKGSFVMALKDFRVWSLFLIYGACFGIEITIDNVAAIYFSDYFALNIKIAGLIAGLFGFMNIFTRAFGGIIADRTGIKWGLKGRVQFLFWIVLTEGLTLILFSRMTNIILAVVTMTIFSIFVQMACGATYAVVPFINKRALGAVSGIVGAGGSVGAVLAGFLFKTSKLTYPQALLILGLVVTAIATLAFAVKFSLTDEYEAKYETEKLNDANNIAKAKVKFEPEYTLSN